MPWRPFSESTIAEGCDPIRHRHRLVTSECAAPGGASSNSASGIGIALANGLFPHGDCRSACLYDPVQPAAAGWAFESRSHCYRRIGPEHGCVAALVNSIDELTCVLHQIAGACPVGSDVCTPLPVASMSALRSTGCGPAYPQRNESEVCSDSAEGTVQHTI